MSIKNVKMRVRKRAISPPSSGYGAFGARWETASYYRIWMVFQSDLRFRLALELVNPLPKNQLWTVTSKLSHWFGEAFRSQAIER
jgi:hypothetical protein